MSLVLKTCDKSQIPSSNLKFDKIVLMMLRETTSFLYSVQDAVHWVVAAVTETVLHKDVALLPAFNVPPLLLSHIIYCPPLTLVPLP